MLSAIRERATGWVAWVIIIFITIPFALWGINSYFEGGSTTPIATVNGVEISQYTYQNELSAQRQALAERLGRNVSPEILDTLGIKPQVVESLVANQLLRQYVIEQNLQISDDQLRSLIRQNPLFVEDGQFSQQLYTDLLRSNQLTPQGFEQSQRLSEIVNQFQSGIVNSSFYTEAERDRLLVLFGQSRVSQFVVLESNRFSNQYQISDDEIQKYYDNNIDQYQTEARIRVNYVELGVDALASTIEPSEEEILQTYEETKGRYKRAESRKASHILFAVNDSASDADKQAKQALAESTLKQIEDGKSFEVLAQLYSDDPGSKENGGDLGVIAPGQMVKPFEDALFSMPEGEVRGPIKSKFGYHIIKLTSLEAGSQQSLDEVRDQVIAESKKFKAENLFAELAESFQNLVFEDPDNLETSADELSLKIQTSDWFTFDQGQGIATENAIRIAAFSEDVLNENLVSPAIEIGFDRLVAVQKLEYEAAHPEPLESVKTEIAELLRSIKSQDQVLQFGSDLLSETQSGQPTKESWMKIMESQALDVKTLADKKYDVSAELGLLADSVFSLPVPQPGSVEVGGVALDNGDYILFALEKVAPGNLSNIDDAIKRSMEQQISQRDGPGLFEQFRVSLRNNADVVISEDQL